MPKKSATKGLTGKLHLRRNFFVLGGFSFVFLLFLGFFHIFLTARGFAGSSADSWLDSSYLSFIVVGTNKVDDMTFISNAKYVVVDYKTKKILTFDLLGDIVLDLPGDFKSTQFSKLFAVTELNEALTKEEAINSLIGKYFGLYPARYIILEETNYQTLNTFLFSGSLIQNLTFFMNEEKNIQTNFSLKEIYDLKKFILGLLSDRIYKTEILQASSLDPVYIDEYITDITFNSDLALEGSSVAVLNGTSVPNIGASFARSIKNHGGRVVVTQNAEASYDKSIIIAQDENSYTAKFLAKLLRTDVIYQKDKYFTNEYIVDRADVVVIIGFDASSSL